MKNQKLQNEKFDLEQIKYASLGNQLDRFINSGFLEIRFTHDLYEMLYIDSNKFIAHFDKQGFYKVRFTQDARETINQLLEVEKAELKPLCQKLAYAMSEKTSRIVVQTVYTSVLAGDKC